MNKRLITVICVLALVGSSPVYAWHHHHSHHSHRGAAAALGFLGGLAVGTMVNRPAPPPRTVVYETPVYQAPAYSAPVYHSPAEQAFWGQSDFVRRQLQMKLQQMGFYHSYVDGAWGPGTQSAFESYAVSTGQIQLLTSYAGANELIRTLLSAGA